MQINHRSRVYDNPEIGKLFQLKRLGKFHELNRVLKESNRILQVL